MNLGEAEGVREGNVLQVVRKGDAYTKKRVFSIPYEDGWPRRVLGALVVVQVLPHTSLAMTTFSRREFERGDHVELRGPGLDQAAQQQQSGRPGADADANVQTDDGRVEGNAGFKIGN